MVQRPSTTSREINRRKWSPQIQSRRVKNKSKITVRQCFTFDQTLSSQPATLSSDSPALPRIIAKVRPTVLIQRTPWALQVYRRETDIRNQDSSQGTWWTIVKIHRTLNKFPLVVKQGQGIFIPARAKSKVILRKCEINQAKKVGDRGSIEENERSDQETQGQGRKLHEKPKRKLATGKQTEAEPI